MKRIVAATDFSTRSDRALRRAVLLAVRHETSLHLVHVIDDDQPAYLIDRQREGATELLAEATRTIREVDKVAAEFVIATGEPFAGILETADDVGSDLVVVGPHRRQFLDTFIGTTAERTIRRSQRPVLMANAMPAGPYRRTLLAVDFDDASLSAVEAVRSFGILDRTELVALHLFDAPATQMMSRAMEPRAAIDDYIQGEERLAREAFGALLEKSGLRTAEQVLKPHRGPAATEILALADERETDLVVVGTNQRKGLVRLLLGSVAQKVLLDAERDVLVVPAVASFEEPAKV
jgi:universal stress protein E